MHISRQQNVHYLFASKHCQYEKWFFCRLDFWSGKRTLFFNAEFSENWIVENPEAFPFLEARLRVFDEHLSTAAARLTTHQYAQARTQGEMDCGLSFIRGDQGKSRVLVTTVHTRYAKRLFTSPPFLRCKMIDADCNWTAYTASLWFAISPAASHRCE